MAILSKGCWFNQVTKSAHIKWNFLPIPAALTLTVLKGAAPVGVGLQSKLKEEKTKITISEGLTSFL